MDLDFIDHEAKERYTSRRQMDLLRCRECMKRNDLSEIETIGHNLKGNGISFGFPELSRLGEEMENSAKNSDHSQVQKLIDRFEEWLSEHLNTQKAPQVRPNDLSLN
ncbi:MAG: Hpt domain-containing protein [Pseudobdellovibrionaceae bacterium]